MTMLYYKEEKGDSRMAQTIITIGRENGSGGKAVGEQLASELGVQCYDKELFYNALREKGLAPEVFQEFDEGPPRMIFSYLYPADPSAIFSERLYQAQTELIREIAGRGESCVLVGRCADVVLKENPNAVRVFIHAGQEFRAARTMEKHRLNEEKALRWNQENDKNRKKYYEHYSMQKWGMARNYHLCLDSGDTGIQGAVELIQLYLAHRHRGDEHGKRTN